MFAIIETGGKQYSVSPGQRVEVEKLDGEIGDEVEVGRVLLLDDENDVHVGKPTVDGAKVTGKIVEQGRGRKVIVFKMKRRKNYRRKQGHRQYYTKVQVTDITKA